MSFLAEKYDYYRNAPATFVRHFWVICLIFSGIDFFVSVGVSTVNDQKIGGSNGLSFAAMWSCLLVACFVTAGCQLIYQGNNSPLMVGFLIGCSAMLAELFFVLMCVFFSYATYAKSNGIETESANNVMGAFSFFNMLVFAIFSVILAYNRSVFITLTSNLSSPPAQPPAAATTNKAHVVTNEQGIESIAGLEMDNSSVLNRDERYSLESITLESSNQGRGTHHGESI
eukprot:gene12748-26848_t